MKAQENLTAHSSQDPVLAEMVRRLVIEFHPHKIFLFGSRAMGTARQDSDYDFLIVMPELNGNARTLAVKAYDLLAGLGSAKDILFTSREHFEKRKTVANTMAEIATTDGIELYAA